jgi:AraC family transcriptional regulator
MLNLEPMVTAVTFIEDCLQENIKVADMADAVNFSLFHFCRTFNKIVHHTPYDYLIRRRLSESARLLLETDQRITDIAFTFQFNSPEPVYDALSLTRFPLASYS